MKVAGILRLLDRGEHECTAHGIRHGGDGSMHDQIVKHWSHVRSFSHKDGHLFLPLMADGGIYEFEPVPGAGAPGASPKS